MKATPQEYDFHRRILARDDPVAFAELADWLYQPLFKDVQKRAGRNADPTFVEEAVGQALLDYHDTPERYDPQRANLRSYLAMAAYRDFQNTCAKEYRRAGHQISLFDPTLQAQEIQDIPEIPAGAWQVEELWHFIDEIFPNPTEQRIVELILNNVHPPEPYAQVLGLAHLSVDEQLQQVRRVKYRITRRLRRRITQQFQRTGGFIQ